MFPSRPCEYAAQALTHLALSNTERLIRAREIAEAENIPLPYLGKVMQDLAKAGLVRSHKGPTGGFRLARPAKNISLLQIIDAISGQEVLHRCAVGLSDCSDETPCPLHDAWKPVREVLIRYLEVTTVADMAEALVRKRQQLGTPMRATFDPHP